MSEAKGRVEAAASERVYVAIGANLGDCRETFSAAVEALAREPGVEVRAASRVYETPPLGPAGQPPYLNAVLWLDVAALSPEALLDRLQAIESELGRDRGPAAVRWGPRTLDLDVLFFGDRVIDRPRLQVPHPRLHERAFVLVPLAELAPTRRHPRLGRTIAELVAEQEDRDEMRPVVAPAGWPPNEAAPAARGAAKRDG